MQYDLSVIIIAKNASQDIKKCLDSVSWAQEIIVLDSGSTDNTVAICQQYTDKVFITDWPGFGIQKNRALDKVTCNWVLSIDADEWLTDSLILELKQLVTSNLDYSYCIPRKSFYCGKIIKFGHWRGDKVLRLFKKGSARFTEDIVHEKLVSKNQIKTTNNYMMHNSFKTHEEVINKMNNYSSLGAEIKFKQGKRGGIVKAVSHAAFAFFKSYVFSLGFLDGAAGLALAISFAEGTYYRYLKLGLYDISDKTLSSTR